MRGAQRPRPCSDREAESDRAERAAVVLCGSMYSSAATIRPSTRQCEKRSTSTIKSAKLEMMRSLRSARLVTKPPHLTGRRAPSHDAAEAPRSPEKWLARPLPLRHVLNYASIVTSAIELSDLKNMRLTKADPYAIGKLMLRANGDPVLRLWDGDGTLPCTLMLSAATSER